MHVGKITNENRIVDMDTIWFPYCEPERSLHQNVTGCALQSLSQHNTSSEGIEDDKEDRLLAKTATVSLLGGGPVRVRCFPHAYNHAP